MKMLKVGVHKVFKEKLQNDRTMQSAYKDAVSIKSCSQHKKSQPE